MYKIRSDKKRKCKQEQLSSLLLREEWGQIREQAVKRALGERPWPCGNWVCVLFVWIREGGGWTGQYDVSTAAVPTNKYCNTLHLGGMIRWLKELPISHSSSWRGWEGLSGTALISSFILLSATDSRLSSSSPTTELASLTSLLSHHPSMPQQRTEHWLL